MEIRSCNRKKYSFKFCPACGAELKSYLMKENEPPRLVCTECGFINYQDPKLVVNSIIEFNNRIIFLKRIGESESCRLALPGGYVDRGETLESAAKREAMEECGIEVGIQYLQGLYSYPGKTEIVAIFIAKYISGELIAGDGASEVKLLNQNSIPWNRLAFPSIYLALWEYSKHMEQDQLPSRKRDGLRVRGFEGSRVQG